MPVLDHMIPSVRKPLVCVDGRMLEEEATGVATYARSLIAALTLLDAAPLVLRDRYRGLQDVPRARPRRERWERWLATKLHWPVEVRRDGASLLGRDIFRRAQRHFKEHGTVLEIRADGVAPGLMHWTYPVPIRLTGWCNLYTVHDAIPLTHAALTPIDGAKFAAMLRAIAAQAGALITVSANSAADIADAGLTGGVPIIDCGQSSVPNDPCAPLPQGLRTDGYFLFCGSIEPRKNVRALVVAWQDSGTPWPLVLVGPDGWRADEVRAGLVHPNLVWLRYVDRVTLATLQKGARALLFPSLAEGFGLPIVEAMALGTPVMTSVGGATEEVAGGAALLVDPRDGDAMARAIARLDTDRVLREALVKAGQAQAERYSLAAFARRLAAAHERVIATAGFAL